MAKDYAKGLYNSATWVKTRNAYYNYRHGLCERCQRPGKIVHHKIHITPRNINNPEITLCFDNLELLCRECHEKHHRPRDNHADGLVFVDGKLFKKKV